MCLAMRCPKLKCGGSKDVVVCLFICKIGTKAKCPEYARRYQEILKLDIEPKYRERYGEPVITLPLSLRKRRKRREE